MRALLVVDIQNDFCPGGALAVPDGDKVIPFVNRVMADSDLVIATQDWHPAGHGSFASEHPGRTPGEVIEFKGLDQILWPDHCIQGEHGAEFHRDLDRTKIHKIFYKGYDKDVDSYSGFFDNGKIHCTGLDKYLREKGVSEVWIAGLATDYCVKFTALDSAGLGFNTKVLLEGSRGVNLNPGDVDAAIVEMEKHGIEVISHYDELVSGGKTANGVGR